MFIWYQRHQFHMHKVLSKCVFMLNMCTDWIAAVVGDNRSARCKVCDIVLPAHHAGLTKHSQNSQHLQRLSSVNLPTKKTSETNVSLSDIKLQVTVLVCLSMVTFFQCALCSAVAKLSVNVMVYLFRVCKL